MSERTASPTIVYLPPIDYPPSLAQQVAAYEAAHQKWREAYAAVIAAETAVTTAPAKDAQALAHAAVAGKAHPGDKHAESARKALELAEQTCKVAREAATAQTDIINAALSDADELLPITIAHGHAAAANYEAVLAEAKAMVDQAASALVNASGAMRVVTPYLAKHYGMNQVWSSAPIAHPNWPAHPCVGFRARLANLEQAVDAVRASREGRSDRVTARERDDVEPVTA